MEQQSKNDFLKEILLMNINRYDHYIQVANNKANWLITVLVTLFFAIITFLNHTEIFIKIHKIPIIGQIILIPLIIFLFISNIITFFYLIQVIIPNSTSSSAHNSVIFFGDVSRIKNEDDYHKIITSQSLDTFILDLSTQAHILARITNHKNIYLIKSIRYILYIIIPLSSLVFVTLLTLNT